ncbi:MAG: hypothetical protein JWP87_2171, partial [Labilithrix sp.]|nr:hypothetical protein [Labilithrix sp.]
EPAPAAPPVVAPPPAPATAPAPAATQGPRGEGGEALTFEPPPADTPPQPGLVVRPYFLIAGGLKYDVPKGRPEESKQNRVSTFAMGRLGVKATWNDLVSAESELMASGGTSLHGTSSYEGQAALQVRQQVLRLHRGAWRIEVGRLIDESSVDFFSAHITETFLQDTATRDPLLFDGFNLGNGVRGQLELVPGLRAALTFNAGNPVSTTGSLMIGGSYPPFERFYTQPYQSVAQVANHFPDDTFHIMMLTPALLLDTKYVDAKAAVQGFDVNTNTNKEDDDHIRGYNLRGTMRVKLFDGVLVPFANAAYTRNDTLVANDLGRRAAPRYQAVNLGGGIDFDVARRFKCAYDCADGFGIQYQQVQFQTGLEGLVTTNRYANLGATYWIVPNVSLGARLAYWSTKQEHSALTDEKSVIVALRFIMN